MSKHAVHKCPVCSKPFGREFDLVRHQKSKRHSAFKAPDDVARMQRYHEDKMRELREQPTNP
jgi:uncharacterized Zn-finger protein